MSTPDLTDLGPPLEFAPEPPPRGPVVWMRENLFSTPLNSVLTIVFGAVVLLFIRGMLGFVFADARQWDAVATNMRLYFTQAYPEEQYIRVWVSLGVIFALIGLSVAIWRSEARIELRKLTRALMNVGISLAVVGLLAPIAWSTRIWVLAAAALLFGAGYLTNQSFGERVKEVTLPTLAVAAALIGLVIAALWVIPIGRYSFHADRDPTAGYEPGTIALSTKLPWTLLYGVLIAAYFLGKQLISRVPERPARNVMVGLWILSFPTIILVILRDPAWDFDQVLSTDVPLFFGFVVGGGLIIAYLSNPNLKEAGRLAAGLLLLVALASWAFPMLIKIRLLLLLLAIFALAAPTFAGDRDSRKRYLYAWAGLVLIFLYFTAVSATGSTLVLQTKFLGGLALTFVLALSGIVISFPIGVLMALGRTSSMPIFRVLSTVYIEMVRGVPFITLLIFSDIILELFLPDGLQLDDVVQAIAATAFFSGAYLAENVRGGLQSVRKGQYEAANALGMTTLQLTALIVLPQALRAVIPALVGQTIAIFKDTSLVTIIGLFDFLYIGSVLVSKQVSFLGSRRESLLFVALGYWVFTFTFSRASLRLEKKLGLGER
jgi:general L-amino acid transport system permease protein